MAHRRSKHPRHQTTIISADRGNAYPRGVEYPIIDLALEKLINIVELEGLDPKLFAGRVLS